MARQPYGIVQKQIERLLQRGSLAGLSEWQLLERYATQRDERAFEALVARHGPMVLGVCRRVLLNDQAAEDAFQATFLVLLRKAPSLDRGKPLGNWLYTVAYRLALRIRANEARRLRHEAQAARSRLGTESHATTPGDQAVVLEEELQRLPERHRAPLVLCYLEGKTNEQAAEALGCPRGSVAARLAQARERLRQSLARRGFVAPAVGVASALATAASQAAVPLPLLDNTVRAALWFTGEKGAAVSCVSAQAVALARGAFRAMFVNKLKIAAAALLAAAMLGMGATMLLKAAPQASLPAQAEAASPPEDLARGGMARMGPTQLRHGDTVYFAACMPDGKALVTAGRDRTVRLWDLATGKELRRFDWGRVQPDRPPEPAADDPLQRLEHQVRDDLALSGQAALSPDGKLVAASRGGVVCLWETATGTKLQDLQTGQKRVDQLAFAADGKALLTLGPGQASAVWELATGTCVQRIEPRPPTGFYVSPFATILEQIAIVSPGWKYLAFRQQAENDGPWSIHIQERATGKEVRRICTGDGRAPLTFSPDEKVLVWAPFEGGDIVFSDVATGKELRRLGGGSTQYDLATNFAFAADGQSLAVSRASHTVEIWHLTPGQPAGRLTLLSQARLGKKDAPVRPALAFSPDGKKLVCSLGGPALSQFDAETGNEVPGPADGHRAPVSTLALSADGKSLYTCGRGDPVRIWDWATGKETGSRWLPSSATHAAFAADGRWAFADGKVVTLCSADGKKIQEIPFGEMPLAALALSPDGELLAARSHKFPDAAHLWDAKGRHRHTLVPSGDGSNSSIEVVTETTGVVVPDLIFSPDGRFLAGAGSGPLCLWAVDTGHLL